MGTPEQDRFMLEVFKVDVSQLGFSGKGGGVPLAAKGVGADGSKAAGAEPPPMPGSPSGIPNPPPPGAGTDPWMASRGLLATAKKRVSALTILKDPAAKGFRSRLDMAEKLAASGKHPEAAAALAKLAAEVNAAFDASRAPPQPTAEQLAARKAVADGLTKPVGSATAADSALVVGHLTKMPKALLDALKKNGTKIQTCRGSVTDYLTALKGVKPRGWPPGSTWDSVPGLQQPDTKEVVIATIGHAAGNPHVPATGEGHGCADLVIHESAHGVDFAFKPLLSAGAPFNAARTPDKPALDAYESQPGAAGQQETFAESCARFYSNDPSSLENTPHLHKYWHDNPLGPPDPPAKPAAAVKAAKP